MKRGSRMRGREEAELGGDGRGIASRAREECHGGCGGVAKARGGLRAESMAVQGFRMLRLWRA